jgi:hypothetical protein
MRLEPKTYPFSTSPTADFLGPVRRPFPSTGSAYSYSEYFFNDSVKKSYSRGGVRGNSLEPEMAFS